MRQGDKRVAENNLSQEGMDALHREARAAIAVVIERCADAVIGYINPDPDGNGLPLFASAAIRKLGESE